MSSLASDFLGLVLDDQLLVSLELNASSSESLGLLKSILLFDLGLSLILFHSLDLTCVGSLSFDEGLVLSLEGRPSGLVCLLFDSISELRSSLLDFF